MSTQLSENTVKVKLSDLRKHCLDLLEEPAPPTSAPRSQPDDVRDDAAPHERRV